MNGIAANKSSGDQEDVNLVAKVKELELELAQTKLALVEAECRNEVNIGKFHILIWESYSFELRICSVEEQK